MSSPIAIFKYLPRTVRATREGKYFILLILIVGMAALNTGNNLLYLLGAALLSLVILSGLLSEWSLRRLTLEFHRPTHFVREELSAIRTVLHNRKKHLPSFSLRVTCLLTETAAGIGRSLMNAPNFQEARFTKIAPQKEAFQPIFLRFPKRGRYLLEGFKISTTFPFGFFVKSLAWKDPAELWVYPRIGPVSWRRVSGAAREGRLISERIGEAAAFSHFREYFYGDDRRLIHWKLSAREGRWIVKEREREEGAGWTLFFNNILSAKTPGWEERFERAIDLVASLAAALLDAGLRVSLQTATERVELGEGVRHLDRILKTLTLLQPVESKEEDALDRPGAFYFDFGRLPAMLVRTEEDLAWAGKEALFQAVFVVDSGSVQDRKNRPGGEGP